MHGFMPQTDIHNGDKEMMDNISKCFVYSFIKRHLLNWVDYIKSNVWLWMVNLEAREKIDHELFR
jgi:hypothetical protein